MVDANKDGGVDEPEWTKLVQMVKTTVTGGPALVAIRPQGEGDLTLSSVLWKQQRNIPEVPSPLYYKDRVYLIANGGILSCLAASSGNVVYRGRVGAPGIYYSSPVAAAGKVFVASGEGVISVLRAGDSLEVLSNNNLGEPIYGTPAVVGSALYVRSANHLWAFGTR